MRENKRTINRAVRELDREKVNLEKQEKKIIAEIKKAAKANQIGAVKVSRYLFSHWGSHCVSLRPIASCHWAATICITALAICESVAHNAVVLALSLLLLQQQATPETELGTLCLITSTICLSVTGGRFNAQLHRILYSTPAAPRNCIVSSVGVIIFEVATPAGVLAKDLVRTRNYVTKFIEFRSHLQGVALKLEVVRSHEAMATAMKDVTKAMVSLNKQVNVPALQKIMMEFAKENERQEMTITANACTDSSTRVSF
eukprot:15767-Heterococcus_DN1.PRE.3